MSTYYINGYNTSTPSEDRYPYTSSDTGAINFYELLKGPHNIGELLQNNDIILIYDGDYIDDSSNTIEIYNSIKIKSNKDIKVHLPIDVDGFTIYMDNVVFDNIHFHKTDYQNGTMVTIDANNVEISNCQFTYDTSTGTGSIINISNSSDFKLKNSTLNIPLGVTLSYGIYANDSSFCTIYKNVINMNGNRGHAITFLGDSNSNNISYNIIGNFDINKDDNIGIEFNDNGDYNIISHNAIGVSGPKSIGIIYNTNDISGIGIKINNNVIVLRENDYGSMGLYIPYKQDNNVSTFEIVNNIFDYRGIASSIFDEINTQSISINHSIAIDVSIVRGIIDFNDIYGFTEYNIFVNNGAPNVISELGDRTIYVDPRILWTEGVDTYAPTDIRRYYCYNNSECIGAGYNHHHIGIGVDSSLGYQDNHYVNIIDTVTSNIGKIDNNNKKPVYTFFNNVFDMDPLVANGYYRKYYKSLQPYPSEDVYKNQWEYSYNISFPFEVGDHFYNKDYVYVLQHKGDLAPFDGIKCPANPGYGYDSYGFPGVKTDTPYKGYEHGLWGYPRKTYRNNCHPDPCIIQDSYTEKIKWIDTSNDVQFWIQDSIDPECLNI